jgi:hypothetical protein
MPAIDWTKEVASAEKELRSFHEQGLKASRAYTNTLKGEDSITNMDTNYEYNLYWANIQVLQSAMYANPPAPIVKREFDDFEDDVARVASIMMERILGQGIAVPDGDAHVAYEMAVNDRLISGLGQVWHRYVPSITEAVVGLGPEGEEITVQTLEDEEVFTDYLYWKDFLYSPARTWGEVWWVGRRVYMTMEEVAQAFGTAALRDVQFALRKLDKTGIDITPEQPTVKQAEIFEIWCKRDKKVYHWSRGMSKPHLKCTPDPLELKGFFPCPKPLMANTTNSKFVAKSDWGMVKSQYARIDMLSRRIALLEQAIRVAGVYDKNNMELAQLLKSSVQNTMIPVDNWSMLAERGGLKGSVDWFPLEMVVNTLLTLNEQFGIAVNNLYELTGISDIMRGTTAPRETLGAQQLKAQYSSVRLQNSQNKVAYFVTESMRIKADIVTKHFAPENIKKRSNIMFTPDAEYADAAVQLLKDEWAAVYRIEIEPDTMAIPDYNAERAGRIEFITAAGQFIGMIMPLVQQEPGAGPYLMQVLQWATAGFRSARTIEGVFDKAANAINEKLQQPAPPPPPDPAMVKAQADVQAKQMTTQADIANKQAKTQADIQALEAKTESQIAAEQAKAASYVRDESNRLQVHAQDTMTRAQVSAQDTMIRGAVDAKAKMLKVRADNAAKAAKAREPKAK